jgi:hypothetical protein
MDTEVTGQKETLRTTACAIILRAAVTSQTRVWILSKEKLTRKSTQPYQISSCTKKFLARKE